METEVEGSDWLSRETELLGLTDGEMQSSSQSSKQAEVTAPTTEPVFKADIQKLVADNAQAQTAQTNEEIISVNQADITNNACDISESNLEEGELQWRKSLPVVDQH